MATTATDVRRWADRWRAQPPPGWEPIETLCRQLFEDLEHLAGRIDTAVDDEVPEFAGLTAFSARERAWSTSHNTADFLRGVAENRTPSDTELEFRRLIGRRSATRGFPLQPLVASFQIGFREVWSELVDLATTAGGRAPGLLLEGGTTIWQWMNATSNAIADGYQEELSRRAAIEARTIAHFIDTLVRDPASDECLALATGLGLQVDGPFRAVAVAGPDASVDAARTLVAALRERSAYALSAPRGRAAMILAQGIDDARLRSAIASLARETVVGVGGECAGLEGACVSMIEAERALELATMRKRPCWFEDDWLWATALAHRPSVERLLTRGVVTASANPHLAEAVRFFAEHGFSVAEAARNLRVSQNSFRYRLRRWRDLTGWDPWTHDGLTRSIVALAFVPPPNGNGTK